MEYRQLGGAGVRVSALGLGGNNFGSRLDEAQATAIIQHAMDLGVNHIDTADKYGSGLSEEFVGRVIAGQRHEVVLATKAGNPMGRGPNDSGLSYRRLIACCEASLRRLGTDYIDVYYLHMPDPLTPLAESLRALDTLQRQGKVRYAGISNHRAWQVCEALWICDRQGYQAPVVTENEYNLLQRSVEVELLPFIRAHSIGLVPWFPLASGMLTGKYRPGEPMKPGTRGHDFPYIGPYFTDLNFSLVAQLQAFAEERGHTVGELAIAWLLSHPEVPSVIAGAMTAEQLAANVAALEWKLTAAEVAGIEELLPAHDDHAERLHQLFDRAVRAGR